MLTGWEPTSFYLGVGKRQGGGDSTDKNNNRKKVSLLSGVLCGEPANGRSAQEKGKLFTFGVRNRSNYSCFAGKIFH